MAKKNKKKSKVLPRRKKPETISEAMEGVEIRDAQGNLVKANNLTDVPESVKADMAWFRAFHDPDEGEIEIIDLGVSTGELYKPNEE
jgi:hypothetical protein